MSNITMEKGLDAPLMSFETLPIVDLANFRGNGNTKAKKETVAADLGRACRDVGFLYLTNHGLNQDVLDHLFAAAKDYFEQPDEIKNKSHISNSENHRGYFTLFDENTDPEKTADLKEGFDLGRDLDETHAGVQAGYSLYGANQWPQGNEGFRTACEAYQDEVTKLSGVLLHAFALALGLDETYFDDKFDDPLSLLRLLRYPPQGGHVEEETIGCGDHSDYGAFTILAQKDISGLQVQNASGDWVSVPVIEGGLVVNIGEQMARWTNGLFKATRHRVINVSGQERYSIPFFFEPNWSAKIECLDTCHDTDNPPKFDPVLAGPYFLSRLSETFEYLDEGEDDLTSAPRAA